MSTPLRFQVERVLSINSTFLSPHIGCGLMLNRIPPWPANDVFLDVMKLYNFPIVRADKPAVKLLEEQEELMRQFCVNAEQNKMALKLNFRGVYGLKDIFLVLDAVKRTAYFLAAAEHRLALTNYFRDAMFKLPELLQLVLSGSTNRLTPVGWQNLHDVMNDLNFRTNYPGVERIEIMASLPTVRWRKPVLEFGVNMLNFSTARTIRQALAKEFGAPGSSDDNCIIR